jgi:hypothetical protein
MLKAWLKTPTELEIDLIMTRDCYSVPFVEPGIRQAELLRRGYARMPMVIEGEIEILGSPVEEYKEVQMRQLEERVVWVIVLLTSSFLL